MTNLAEKTYKHEEKKFQITKISNNKLLNTACVVCTLHSFNNAVHLGIQSWQQAEPTPPFPANVSFNLTLFLLCCTSVNTLPIFSNGHNSKHYLSERKPEIIFIIINNLTIVYVLMSL